MKAIQTKYVGPSYVRGSRIIATDGDNKVTVGYDSELSTEGAHFSAARALCEKLNWHGTLLAGATKTGYVFVWQDEQSTYTV